MLWLEMFEAVIEGETLIAEDNEILSTELKKTTANRKEKSPAENERRISYIPPYRAPDPVWVNDRPKEIAAGSLVGTQCEQ